MGYIAHTHTHYKNRVIYDSTKHIPIYLIYIIHSPYHCANLTVYVAGIYATGEEKDHAV